MKEKARNIYIYIYKKGIERGCRYLVTPQKWKGARHKNYLCSNPLNRGVSL